MITITDYCDTQTFPQEGKEAIICYARIFLEHIITLPHRFLNVNIHIKPPLDILYSKHVKGYTYQNENSDYDIVLVQDDQKNMIAALSHELVHVKQFIENGFKLHDDYVHWNFQKYMPIARLLSLIRNNNELDYNNLPWELDAKVTLIEALPVVTEKFEHLCQSPELLDNFIKISTTKTEYLPVDKKVSMS